MRAQIRSSVGLALLLPLLALSGCASGPAVKSQDYAVLSTSKAFEYPMEKVYKAVEETLRKHRVVERDPEEPNEVEIRKLTEAEWETDWIYSQSKNKYVEYKVNDLPRKQYLQLRVKYQLKAETQIGAVKVSVGAQEEVQRLSADGKPDGWDSEGKPDTALARRVLDQVGQAILAAAP
ncbi:MAG: hypothetical protein IT285_12060 [Bdellovibrionales bacterium]|nr:hypothetical protein [Bdellovibrionales bacterium]